MISEWAERWLVTVNTSKTVAILFTKRTQSPPYLLFNDVQIQFVDSHKHLPIILNMESGLNI